MKHSLTSYSSLFIEAFNGWKEDNATVWCAALAYFTVFSLGPLLLLVISIVGLISSTTDIEQNMYSQMRGLIGDDGATMLQTVIQRSQKPTTSIISTIIGTVTLILGATGVFGQLQQMFNTIWGVTPKPKTGVVNFIRSRFINFSMVGVISFLLLVSLIATTAISGVGTYLEELLPISPIILQILNFSISLFIVTFLFALTIKILPDVQLAWSNVWIGAIITSVLFTIGKLVIGIYIGRSGVASEYGAAGSLIVLLLWVYYSSQILFFGVEFTKAYTLMKDGKVKPNEYAVISYSEKSTKKQTDKRT